MQRSHCGNERNLPTRGPKLRNASAQVHDGTRDGEVGGEWEGGRHEKRGGRRDAIAGSGQRHRGLRRGGIRFLLQLPSGIPGDAIDVREWYLGRWQKGKYLTNGRPGQRAMLTSMSLNRNADPRDPSEGASELPIVVGAVALLALLLVAFYLVSCRGADTAGPRAGQAPNAETQGSRRVRIVKAVRTIPAARAPFRYFGPWLTPRLRDRALAALPARAEGRAEPIPGIYNGGYGIKIFRR